MADATVEGLVPIGVPDKLRTCVGGRSTSICGSDIYRTPIWMQTKLKTENRNEARKN